ncbi:MULTISPECIES: hypothetical protein [unclassified Streptomyces]|uniref:hypothetical protein n=1 Tax=unclassified Streptomyces TaxID=2593676 RepID=UPI002DDA0EE3|nr:hypothetical protein [Streptomyces sp. NBC_00243]WRZ17017.1 DUF4265 domain-containing protein [Streptomyces sp. NBC_00243]WRZ25647.1 DUF4265 domain-containing protein [Streptomyces sp. NBC_00243]
MRRFLRLPAARVVEAAGRADTASCAHCSGRARTLNGLGRSISLIKNSIKESGLLSEWHGERFVAIDVPPGTDMSPLFALLQREVDEAGAFWEWADAMPFSTERS